MAAVNPADKLSLSLDAIISQNSSRPSGSRGFRRGGPVRAEADFSGDVGGQDPDAAPRESAGGSSRKVFVNNLSYETNWQGLKDHFKAVGNVTYADVLTEGRGPGARSKGCGIVEFESPSQAQAAIGQLSETNLNGRNILVREDRGSFTPDGREGGALSQQRRAGAGREPRSFDRGAGGYGGREGGSVYDRYDRQDGGGRDFDRREGGYARRDGFSRERSPPPAPADMECYECGQLGHRARDCPNRGEGGSPQRGNRRAPQGGAGTENRYGPRAGRQIVVHGLPYSFQWQDLKDMANESGGAVKADISTDRQSGRSRGFGTVLFETEEAAQAAIEALAGQEVDGRYITAKLDEYAT